MRRPPSNAPGTLLRCPSWRVHSVRLTDTEEEHGRRPLSHHAAIVRGALAAAVWIGFTMLGACQLDFRVPPLGSPGETMSDADHGAAAAAADAMDAMSTDPEPDTEVHLSLAPARVATADDSTRADLLLVEMREALRKYGDVRVAAADGFEELPATQGKHTVHHLSNWAWARAEAHTFDPARPTSLLYREGTDGTLALIGAMYTAPAGASIDELDRRIPVSLARWHRHINWCAPKSGSGSEWVAVQDGVPLYGPRSPVASREACESTGGIFFPGIFGWMAHVTLNGSDDPRVVWSGAVVPGAADSLTPRDSSDRARAVQVAVASPPVSPQPQAAVAPRGNTTTHPSPTTRAPTPTDQRGPGSAPLIAASVPRQPSAVPHPPDRADPTLFGVGGHVSSSFTSARRPIAYDRFTPPGAGRHPALLLLHGDGGVPPQAARFEEFADALTRREYVVEIVHYFDRTGTIAADQSQRMLHFHEWEETVRDAVSDLARMPGVDSTRIGIFGTGIGATLALAAGANDARVRVVVEYEGSLPTWAVPTVHRMPPVFIGQSEADPAPAVREANRIRAICEAVNAPVVLTVYPTPNRGRYIGTNDLRLRTVSFLDKYLRSNDQ